MSPSERRVAGTVRTRSAQVCCHDYELHYGLSMHSISSIERQLGQTPSSYFIHPDEALASLLSYLLWLGRNLAFDLIGHRLTDHQTRSFDPKGKLSQAAVLKVCVRKGADMDRVMTIVCDCS